MPGRTTLLTAGLIAGTIANVAAARDYPPFKDVAKDYEEVVSTADGSKPLYGLYIDKKRNQLLAELPRGWQRQKHLFAVTQASGSVFAGLQGPAMYGYWKQYDDRIALIAPELGTRSTGEAESRASVDRLFTDTVVVDMPIVCMGPSGQPVIDLDELLVGRAGALMPSAARGNARLMEVAEAKAFPQNIEVQIEVPVAGGKLTRFHYSISNLPDNSGYKPRVADERVGYFTTVYRDLGKYKQDEKWVRYINRWHLEKRDPKLSLSPPKQPIVYYIEHTVPVRYRRWVRQGAEFWNDAFRKIGIEGAIEVRYQDKVTGAHMEKDPEDVRYNFIRWLNNDISTAIGPSRAHPLTGEILDADVVLTDGWIRAYWGWYHEDAPELGVESFSEETLRWLHDYPEWDPRLLLSSPQQRDEILARRAERERQIAAGEISAELPDDYALLENPELAAMHAWMSCGNLPCNHHECLAAHGLASNMAFAQMTLETLGLIDEMGGMDGMEGGDTLDDIPEWFIGPFVAELVCHEVGHTLGLRHNFKSSAIYTLEEINSEAHKGKKTIGGSVMDYLPPNFNLDSGETQGDFAMIGLGPYDYWAIEYGYTFGDTDTVLSRVGEPELVYLTDDDTGGPDPLARRYDFSKNPLDYAENQMRIVNQHRDNLLDKLVKDGQSWSKARSAYQKTLGQQQRMLSMMANWIGGAHVNRARKGDVDGLTPIEVVDPKQQRAALEFVIENSFHDEAFGLTPELILHLTVDKWSDQSPGDRSDPTWPVHDRVSGVQGSALTMILNPTTLDRVYDNEFRTPEDEDALTLPELLDAVVSAAFTELDGNGGGTYSDRKPMISSLRRNLQAGVVSRLVVMADGPRGIPAAAASLCRDHLRELDTKLTDWTRPNKLRKLDRYSQAHLRDLKDRIDAAFARVEVKE